MTGRKKYTIHDVSQCTAHGLVWTELKSFNPPCHQRMGDFLSGDDSRSHAFTYRSVYGILVQGIFFAVPRLKRVIS